MAYKIGQLVQVMGKFVGTVQSYDKYTRKYFIENEENQGTYKSFELKEVSCNLR